MTKRVQLTDDDRQRITTAFHEAGHAVACVALGGRVHQAMLGDTPRTEYDDLPVRYASDITYAGPWCEARWLARQHPGPRDMHRVLLASSSDNKALCAAGGPAAALGVVPLLERCWPAVKAVTKKLFHDGRADHGDVCTALGLTDGGGPGSFELAMIRSGSAPRTFTVTHAAR